MTQDPSTTDRRTFLKTTAALPLTSVDVLSPSDLRLMPQGTLSKLANLRVLSYRNVPDAADIPTFRDADVPMWHVEYVDGEAAKLRDTGGWLDSGDRVEHRHIPELNESQLSASDVDIHALAAKSWIESIDLVQTVSIPEPIQQAAAPADLEVTEGLGWYQRLRTDTGALESGLAFDEDMPEATVAEVVAQTNADYSTLPDLSSYTLASIDTGVTDGSEFEDSTGTTRIVDTSKDFIADETGVQAVSDQNSHGTWTASLMAASPSDSSYEGYLSGDGLDILVAKALNDDGSGSTADIVAAIRYCADEGADAACLSLGSPVYSTALDRAISYAAGAGMPCFVATGNDRYASRWTATPSDTGDAFAVAAATAEAPTDAKCAYFANHGPDPGSVDASAGATQGASPDGIAPGCKIEASLPGFGYVRLSGTSMAAPSYAAAAILLQAETSLDGDVDAIYKRLREFAAPAPAIGVTEAGAGYLDVKAAVNQTEPDQTHEEARDDEATARDEAHRALSDASGGWL
jgi:subtilisin family serine protease